MQISSSDTPPNALLDAAFEHAGVTLCLLAPDNTILRVNAEWVRSTGIPRDVAVGGDILDLFPEARAFAKRLHARARAGEMVEIPRHATTIRGTEVWWEGRISPVPMDTGVALLITALDVSAEVARQREAEAALREREAFLRKVIDAAPSMVFVKDREGRFVLANEALARCYGTSVADVVGKRDADFNPSSPDVVAYRRDDVAVMDTRAPQVIEREPVRHASGEVRWYTTVKVPLVGTDGRCDEVLGISTDITALKRTEDDLNQTEQRFRFLANAMPQIVCVLAPDGSAEYVSPSWVEYSGLDLQATQAAGWQGVLHPDDIGAALECRRRILRRLDAEEVELRYRRADGSYRWFLSRVAPIVESGRVVRLVGAAMDIEDRKRALEAARASEEQLRTLADTMPQLVWTNRPDGGPEFFNRHWREYTGTTLADAQADAWARVVHPDDRARTLETWHKSLGSGEPYEIEYRLRDARNGAYRWFLARALPIRDDAGAIVRWFGTCTDIEDRKRAEAEVVEAEQAVRASEQVLREEHRRKDEFLGMLSHELRNPLAPIRNSVFLLRNGGAARADGALQVIERQTAHLTRLVDDLLDVTRVARGKIQLRRERVDLREVLRRSAEDFRCVLEERGVALTVALSEQRLWVDADATRIAQVIGNLLHNAAKFTRRGDTVTVSAAVEREDATVRVIDTGVGIDPSLLHSIFDPFTQAKQTLARSEGGLGLGLALVKGLVALHDGRVTARSAGAGRGAEFIIDLPLASAPETRTSTPCCGAESGCRRVLVVDDNKDAADSMAALLATFGHEADVVYDAESAVAKARRCLPDVIFCDIGLPGMDGYEVARQIRAFSPNHVRLVALSGYSQPEDVARALEAGFDAHVAKPADPASIQDLLA